MKSFLLFFYVFFLSFRPLLPIIEYLVDYKYISKVLCINKDKPEMECNGKCHLKKELAESTKENTNDKRNNSFSFNKLLKDFLFIEKFNFSVVILPKIFFTKNILFKQIHYAFLVNNKLYKPPIS